MNWNEAVDPTSVQANDLMLTGNTGAAVTNVQSIKWKHDTRFTLHILFEGV